jgi:hypothetical protein
MSKRFVGDVIRKPYATGSKSEHAAVMLVTGSGEYHLRRAGGNPFSDPELNRLVGHRIACEGIVRGSNLIMSNWELRESA